MENGLLNWLLEQAPVIVVMGVAIWWLAKRLVKSEEEKDSLANSVIKITTLWEAKASELGEDDKNFKEDVLFSLKEIKLLLKNKKTEDDK